MPYLRVRCCVCRRFYGRKRSLVAGISDGYCVECARALRRDWFGRSAEELLAGVVPAEEEKGKGNEGN